MEIEAAKVIGAGLAVIGVIGSGIGIGNIFSSFIEAREKVISKIKITIVPSCSIKTFCCINTIKGSNPPIVICS